MAFVITILFRNVPYIRNTEQLLGIPFWLKSKSFDSNFSHLAKVLATTNSEPG